MSDNTERPKTGQSRMTLRVYRATLNGIVTDERAEIHVMVGDKTDVYVLAQAWPPCRCPRHRPVS